MELKKGYEYVIIGSGFGGACAALSLARAGHEVLIVERGIWPRRDDTCWNENILHLSKPPLYQGYSPVLVNQKEGRMEEDWPYDTVGGMSTFYGCASFRLREDDFNGAPLPGKNERDTSTAWPVSYKDLAPFYDQAEELLGIAGNFGEDITEPPRGPFPQKAVDTLSAPSKRIYTAANKLGLHPFHLPMAINFDGQHGKNQCILCNTCDHYLCKLEAKNDLSVNVIPEALAHGAKLLPDTRAVRLNITRGKADSVDLVQQTGGECYTVKARHVILAAGAIGSPHLLLASGASDHVKNPDLIGRYLMRHSNGVLAGVFPYKTNRDQKLQKMLGIPDYYHGGGTGSDPEGPWGIIQEISGIGKGVIKANSPMGLKNIAAALSDFMISLLVIAEDIPQYDNRITLDPVRHDPFGMPLPVIYHRYHSRDLAVRKALYWKAFRILRKAGALLYYPMPITTFSHALGTCRMGNDSKTSVVDTNGRVHGIKNVYITDASIMPTGGSVNPSLTIAAMSLRIASHLGGK